MHSIFFTIILCISTLSNAFAAVPLNLRHLSPEILKLTSSVAREKTELVETRSEIDFNQTQHIHFQQHYENYLVWGTQSVIHIAKGGQYKLQDVTQLRPGHLTANGKIYQNLVADLQATPSYAFSPMQIKQAKEQAIALVRKEIGDFQIESMGDVQRIVYVDNENKAHWAYYMTFYAKKINGEPMQPTFILDATHFTTYQYWNNLQTIDRLTHGGGWGGNKKSGKILYDGQSTHLPNLLMTRNEENKVCYLKNDDVTIVDAKQKDAVINFSCTNPSKLHQNLFWDGLKDQINGGYSPVNDALFIGGTVKQMYQQWYNIPVLSKKDKPMMLIMRMHEAIENAYWDGKQMTFGDGGKTFYPLVSLGVGAHEMSHGFTQQHAGLLYYGEAGAINESFSDMAAQAAEFFVYKKSSWQIGEEILKEENKSLRYLDEPTKDCEVGQRPGHFCSINNMKDYHYKLDVHFGSGVFNKLFYLLSTAEGWDTQKAFNVMVQANRYYWTPTTSFSEAACGILTATRDFKYDLPPVQQALRAVGIDSSEC